MSTESAHTMDILSIIFFLVAGAWLMAALLYSLLVLCFLRLRSNGQLGSVYDEEFGRVQMGCCSLPLGCIFRRYAHHLNLDLEQQRNSNLSRFMLRSERREAILQILDEQDQLVIENKKKKRIEEELEPEPDVQQGDNDIESAFEGGEEPLTCSICLDTLEDPFTPKACRHSFHLECILDWLQRQDNTACPICRSDIVHPDHIWGIVKRNRKEKRKQKRKLETTIEISETEQDDEFDVEQ